MRHLIALAAALAVTSAVAEEAAPEAEAPAGETVRIETVTPAILLVEVCETAPIPAPKVLHIDGTVECRVDEVGNLNCTARRETAE